MNEPPVNQFARISLSRSFRLFFQVSGVSSKRAPGPRFGAPRLQDPNRFLVDPRPEATAQVVANHDVRFAMQHLAQERPEPGEVDQRELSARHDLDHYVDVALISGIAARGRAEQAQTGNATRPYPARVFAQKRDDPLAMCARRRTRRGGEGALNRVRFAVDHGQKRARGSIGLPASLLPVPHCRWREAEPEGEPGLRKPEARSYRFDVHVLRHVRNRYVATTSRSDRRSGRVASRFLIGRGHVGRS